MYDNLCIHIPLDGSQWNVTLTLWHGNAFRFTGPSWGEITGGFSIQRTSNAELFYVSLKLVWTSCWTKSICRWFETPWRWCGIAVAYLLSWFMSPWFSSDTLLHNESMLWRHSFFYSAFSLIIDYWAFCIASNIVPQAYFNFTTNLCICSLLLVDFIAPQGIYELTCLFSEYFFMSQIKRTPANVQVSSVIKYLLCLWRCVIKIKDWRMVCTCHTHESCPYKDSNLNKINFKYDVAL